MGGAGALHARVVAEVERLVGSGHLRPGDRLPPERELARILGVGRSSLREAIAVLAARGLLEVRHGRGTYVAPPEPGATRTRPPVELREIFDLRELLEVAAAGWAAEHASDAEVDALRATTRALVAAAGADPPDLERLQELDTRFHLQIAAMAHNRFLEQTAQVLHRMLATSLEATLVIPGRIARSRRSHLRIAEAIARGDAASARAAMRRHLREVRREALAHHRP